VLWARGELDGADEAFVRTQQVREAALGLEHPLVAVPLTRRGQLLTERGRAREAVPLLERALAIRTESDEPIPLRIQSAFALAQALWAAGRDRARARALAEQALADAERTEDEDAGEITAWLTSHRI
jgi:tetratricopeptide (TPR) repeat protein